MRKRILLLFLGLCCICNVFSQIVTIPDANFKAKLISLGVDTNNDGDIQVSEAQNVTQLDVSNMLNTMSIFIDVTGIEAFTNLTYLDCSNNSIGSLDLSTLSLLTELYCDTTALGSLDILNNPLLTTLNCRFNSFTTLDLSNCANLTTLNCGNINITNLDLSFCPNLTSLSCDMLAISSLDLSNTPNLTSLNCSYSSINSLDLSNTPNLTSLNCSNSSISSLDLSNIANLVSLHCDNTYISNLDVSNCPQITTISCVSNVPLRINASNCASLNYLDYDANAITDLFCVNCTSLSGISINNPNADSIDVSGSTALTDVFAYHSGLNYLKVSNCTSLTNINCIGTNLTNLDVSNLPQLAYLECDSSQITRLNAANCSSLSNFSFQTNPIQYFNILNCTAILFPLSQIDFSNSVIDSLEVSGSNIAILNCPNNNISYLSFSNCPNLASIFCPQSNLTHLDLVGLPALQTLSCGNNQLTQLDLSNLNSLVILECDSNLITNLDISNHANIQEFFCAGNPLERLNAANCTNLTNTNIFDFYLGTLFIPTLRTLNFLNCVHFNFAIQLTSSGFPILDSVEIAGSGIGELYCDSTTLDFLSVSNCPNLNYISCNYNNLTNLDVSNLPDLTELYCHSNQISNNLDLSDAGGLMTIDCSNNAIPSLSLKNNSIEGLVDFSSNPNLTLVCADATQVMDLQTLAQSWGMTNVVVDSTCNLPPAGNYNTLTGTIHFDSDNNGCTPNDLIAPYFTIKIISANDTLMVSTDNLGNYTAYLDSGAYTLEPKIANAAYFSISPASQVISFPNNNFNTLTQDFCLSAIGTVNDLEVNLVPLIVARPGFPATYNLIYRNNGNQALSGSVNFVFDDTKMSIDSASDASFVQNVGELSWAYSNLAPFEIRNIVIYSTILPPPANNIGDALNFSANISPIIGDNTPNNNSTDLAQIVIGAYDPNDKMCVEGETLPSTKIGDYLHYLVRFQNTGNFYAQNVVVVDSINEQQYDLSSLSIINASHNMHAEIVGNEVSFVFENIMLPDSFTNEPASHGYVLFQLKTKNNLTAGTTVSNKAAIYFDYNLPIITNDATTLFYAPISGNNTTIADVSCNGQSNGSAQINPNGGFGTYTVFDATGNNLGSAAVGTPFNFNGLAAGTYHYQIQNMSETYLDSFVISQPNSLAVTTTAGNILCNGGNTNISLNVNGGIAPYNYAWSNNATNNNITVGAGTYSVNISDANGCTSSQNVSISEPSALSSVNNSTNVNCNGASTGTACVNVSGGVAPYNYVWSNGQTTSCANNLGAGTYSVNISDANGCISSQNVTISEPSALSSVNNSTNVNCNGASTGTACVNVSGGITPYNYAWSNGQTASCANNLGAGNYSVNISDANGCITSQNVTISEPSALSSVNNSTNVNCNGASTGTACVNVSGGTTPYNYAWSNGQTGSCANNLGAGNYSVNISDANGCTTSQNVTISEPSALSSVNNSTDVNCNGATTGTACVNVSGGTTPYNYAWSNGQTASCANSLGAGNYSVNISDANGCIISQNVTISEPSALSSLNNSTNVNCNGATTGTACVNVSGGVAPYNYAWSNGQTASCANNLGAGNYSVNISDANGCISSQNVTITQPSALNVIANGANATCTIAGSACAVVSGGTTPYNYVWSNGLTTSCANNLNAGNYSVNVTDANGCQSSKNVTVGQSAALNVTMATQSITCNGLTNGSACANITSGTAPYTYSWSNNATTNCINNLSAGAYAVNVADANGCTSTQNITVTEPTALALSVATTNVNGSTLGSATANPSGGMPPYTYYWTTTSTSPQIANLNVGTYAVFITDANGCQINKSVTITNTTDVLDAFKNDKFSLFPNPNTGDFVLKSFSNANYEANVSVFDMTGRSVYTEKIILNAQSEMPFHLQVSQGVYFLKMETKEGIFFQKFVIE